MLNLLNRVDEEVQSVIGEPWVELKKQNNTYVARHSLLVVMCVVNEPMFAQQSPEL